MPNITQTLSTKHPLLKRNVTFKVLTDQEMTEAFQYGLVVDFDGLDDDLDVSPIDLMLDMIRTNHNVDLEIHTLAPLYRVFETLAFCIVNFEKHLPHLLKMTDEAFGETVKDLYRTCINLNPGFDFETFKTLRGNEPIGEDLERAASYLPELDPSVAAHIGRLEGMAVANEPSVMFMPASVIDHPMNVEDLLGEELPEGALETLDAIFGPRLSPAASKKKEEAPEELVAVDLDPEKVKTLKEKLAEKVVGQPAAIEAVYSAIKRAAVGFRDETRPISVLMFAGPTGVGKTLLSEETAKELFGDKTVARIDCAGLSKEYDVSKLLGPAPGYLGYPDVRPPMPTPFNQEEVENWNEEEERKKADPSILWKAVKNMRDGGVLILDEIEKAHFTIQDQFLTIFDNGYITTSVGNKVDFRNILIVMTSNIGSREMQNAKTKNPLGFCAPGESAEEKPSTMDASYVKKTTTKAAKKWFKPEVMGRINLIVPFTDLDEDQLLEVVELEWRKSLAYLGKKIKAEIILGDKLREKIAKTSKSAGYGARLISRLIESYVNDQLAELYLDKADVLEDESRTVEVEWIASETDNEIVRLTVDSESDYHQFTISKSVVSAD